MEEGKAFRAAEKKTSGEIRLHVESRCWRDPLRRASLVFKKLKMDQTKDRNATLIYVSMKSRKFAIVGDSGIHDKVAENYWESLRDMMGRAFTEERICEGICAVIDQLGTSLKEYFPAAADDQNELPDEISFGD